jgi:hypothetical protein
MLTIGLSKSQIDVGQAQRLVGYGYRNGRKMKGMHDPIYCRALALREGEKQIVVLVNDLIGLSEKFVRHLRYRISNRTSVDASDIMVACTHVHSSPSSIELKGVSSPNEKWIEHLEDTMIRTALDAISDNRKIEKITWSRSSLDGLSYNRCEPTEGVDNELSVISFSSQEGTQALVANYACHPTILGPDNHFLSSDFPGSFCKTIESEGVDLAVFCNGAAGDIDPVYVAQGRRDFASVSEMGKKLAGSAIDRHRIQLDLSDPQLNSTNIVVGIPLLIPNKETIKRNIEEQISGKFLSRKIRLPIGKKICEDQGHPNEKHHVEPLRLLRLPLLVYEGLQLTFRFIRYFKQLERIGNIRNFPKKLKIRIQIICIGSGVLIAIPAELFSSIGSKIKELSPFPFTMVVAYANGLVGYISDWSSTRTVYEIEEAPIVYGFPPFSPDAGDLIVSEVQRNLQSLWKRA